MNKSVLTQTFRLGIALLLTVQVFATQGSARARVIYVPANVAWLDTGLSVKPGQIITISATGSSTTLAESPSSVSGPEGQSVNCPDPDYPPAASYPCHLNGAPYGTLIGRIGSGAPVRVGSSYQAEITAGGKLYLGVNDHLFFVKDNQGGYDVQITVTNPNASWCASTDITAVFGCSEVSIKPAGLTGDFYSGSTLLASAQNPGRLILSPGSNKIDLRNIRSNEEGFGTLFNYADSSATVTITENQVKSTSITPRKKYIRGTLELTCDIKSYAGENVGCSVSLDGTSQPAVIAAGQKMKYVLDPGVHTVSASLTGDPAQTLLWAPASVVRTLSVSPSAVPKKVTVSFSKAGHLTANLDQPGVVGDWYMDGVQVGIQTASLDQWITPGTAHKVEVKNLTVLTTPVIHPWKDAVTSVVVASGQSKTVTVKLQKILPGGVKVINRPQCRIPSVNATQDVVIRIIWGALRRDLAEQNADHMSFRLLLDSQDVGDVRPFRQPVQAYNPAATLGCSINQLLYVVHWDIPVGRLAAGTHTISTTLFSDAEIFDGVLIYQPGPFLQYDNVLLVTP